MDGQRLLQSTRIQHWRAKTNSTRKFRWLKSLPLRIKLAVAALLLILLIIAQRHGAEQSLVPVRPVSLVESSLYQPALPPPEITVRRLPDVTDTFRDYKYRDACNISSNSLHSAFSPLCSDRGALLSAISSGGRIGFDGPYIPRGCDMRWFSTNEICEILARFDKVLLIGDSMLRHVMGAINVMIREDLGYGAVTGWNFNLKERQECFCNEQFDVKACSVQGVYKTSDVMAHDPSSLACPLGSIALQIEQVNRYPFPHEEEIRLVKAIRSQIKRRKPTAIILGHGLWSDLDHSQSLKWIDAVLQLIDIHSGTASRKPAMLFLPPSASGSSKPQEWEKTQGNRALMLFEEMMAKECEERGVDVFGTWNMSIQARKYDGVHLDLKGNLVKAMGVMNWLGMVDI